VRPAGLPDLYDAYAAQQSALVAWLTDLPAPAWDLPSRLPGWTVRELAFHATDMTSAVVRAVATGPVREPALTIAEYTSAWSAAGDEIAARDRERAADLDPAAVLANADVARRELLEALAETHGDPVLAGRRGPIRLGDLMTTRVNELVVHSIDLSTSVPDSTPVGLDPRSLAVACRMLAAILVERAPGRAVEVRVPPYVAVQCVAGPRHTRGTPGNVVEVQPVAWVALATGRLTWDEAVTSGRVSASGERADLSELLPVLA
jgi:uncharacterized protein (TIGR03083 family)